MADLLITHYRYGYSSKVFLTEAAAFAARQANGDRGYVYAVYEDGSEACIG